MNIVASNKNGDTVYANIPDDAIFHTIAISCSGLPCDIQEPIPTNPKIDEPYFTIPDKAWGGTWVAKAVSGDYASQDSIEIFDLIDE